MSKKMTQKQLDKLFITLAHGLLLKFSEHVEAIYNVMFSDKKRNKEFKKAMFKNIGDRLIFEFGLIYSLGRKPRGKRNAIESKAKTSKTSKKAESQTSLV